ncbi:MAG: hypothetical protein JWM92_53 [Candidatus Nomurabacteria bacterium]|nr:hypothetical protein [Candidatus Nomurabacteria bacterium]
MKLYDVIRKDEQDKRPKGQAKQVVEVSPDIVKAPKIQNFNDMPPRGPHHISWKKITVIGGALVFLALLYVGGTVLVHAKITVTQRQIPFSLQNAQIDLTNSANADPGRLSFQTMVVTDSVSRQVFASAMTTSTTTATGEAVIFNQYSKSSQTVRKGTTLTGTNAKRYVTQAAVIVPGYTGSGSQKVAGSAHVAIAAADVGPTYNSNGTSFIIAGWGGANAKLFFATSAGAITGGQNGAMHTLSDADKQQATATLQAALREKLSRETRAQIPDNLITFPDMQFTNLDANSLNLIGPTIQFAATLKGTMVSYLIPRDLLEQAIASKAISDHLYPDVSIPSLGNVQVTPVSVIPTDPKNTPPTITVAVSGQGVIITKVAPTTIQQDVLGMPRGSFTQVFSAIPEVDTASYRLMPFWAPYFPYKASRISVVIN